MCLETKQYLPCSCYTLLHRVCAKHIAHTHKQTDEAPCPDLRKEVIEGGRRCLPDGCEHRRDEFFTFESSGRGLFENEVEKRDAWRKEREEREQRREQLKIGEYKERDPKRLKGKKEEGETETETETETEDKEKNTSSAMVLASDDPEDISSAFKSFRESCPNKDCLDPEVNKGVCSNCGTIAEFPNFDQTAEKSSHKSFTNRKCLEHNVSDGYCRNCSTVVDRERFATVVKSETCFNKECHEPNVIEGYFRACETSNSCSNVECDMSVVKHGVCKSCISIVDEKVYMADINTRLHASGLPRCGGGSYTKCPGCNLPDVFNGTCQNCQKKVPICANDECNSYDISSGICNVCHSACYDEQGVLAPAAIIKKDSAAHDANVEGGVFPASGILIHAAEAEKGEEEAIDMEGVE